MVAVKKVVIDTNVFISAFGWGGKPLKLMDLLEQGAIRNCVSRETLEELVSALAYPKLSFSHTTQTHVLEFVLSYSDMYEPKERLNLASDPDDNKFIECAAAAHAGIIVTGDKKFQALKRHGRIRIMSAEDFLRSWKQS